MFAYAQRMKSGLPSMLPAEKNELVLFLIIAKPFFLGLHAHTQKAVTLSQCVKVDFVGELRCRSKHCKGVLWHSTEVGNTRSPWAPPAPDLNHSRSQWPSACLPSCQAALSQTCCKHADNKFRKPSGKRSKKKKKNEAER